MPRETTDNSELSDYLLGSVEPGTQEQIEERLMTDDHFFEDLLAAEEDLIQDYVDKDLTPAESSKFESHFLNSPERQQKLDFARALRKNFDVLTDEKAVEQSSKEKPLNFLQRLFAAPLPAAAGLLVIFTLSSLAVWNFLIRPDNKSDLALASLNKVYQTERPLESRISGLNYAPLKNTRGGESKIDALQLDVAKVNSLTPAAADNPTAADLHAAGRFFLTQKNFNDAIEQLEKAEKLDPDDAQIQNDLGIAYLEKSNLSDENLELLGKASEKFGKAIKLDPGLPEAFFNRAIALQKQNLPNQAKEAWQEYLKLDTNSQWSNEVRENIKILESQSSSSKDSDELLRDFLTAYRSNDSETAYRIFTNNREMIRSKLIPQELAFLFLKSENQSERTEALAAIKSVGKLEKERTGDAYFSDLANYYGSISEPTRSRLLAAQSLVRLGYAKSLDEKYIDANADFQMAEKLFNEAGNQWEAGLCDYWIAYTDYRNNQIELSTERLEQLSEYCESNDFKWLGAQAAYWLSTNAKSTNEISRSIRLAEKSLKLSEEVNDLYNTQKSFSWLADLHLKINQPEKAFNFLQKTLEFDRHPDSSARQKGRDYEIASRLFYAVENYEMAAEFQKEMLFLYKTEIGDSSFERGGLANLGVIYAAKGEFEQALSYAERSLKIAEAVTDKGVREKSIGYANLGIADIQRKEGDCRNASATYTETIEIFRPLQFQSYLFSALKGRLLCSFQDRDFDLIESELPETLAFFEDNRDKIVGDQNRTSFSENEQGIYDFAIDFEISRGNTEKAFDYSEVSRARSLLDLINNGSTLSDDPMTAEHSVPLKIREIQSQLSTNVQIIEYAVLDQKVLIWLVSNTDLKSFSSEITLSDLDKKITDFNQTIEARDQTGQQNLSRELYQILFAPLEKDLDKSREIFVVPDKRLVYLPFAALISTETDKYLIEDYKIGYTPSANIFLASSRTSREQQNTDEEKLLSVGNPSFDRNEYTDLSDLPSAEQEARNIARLYRQPTLLIEKQATKSALLRDISEADIIHFAGHYVVNEQDSMKSGFLTANENGNSILTNNDLSGTNLARTKLIVLSACETAVEKYYLGEGMIGAGRTFLALGVPTVVASQWPVDSEATAKLMEGFHKHRKEQNQSTMNALQSAQIEMLKGENENYRDPYYWAGFLMLGS